MMDELLEIGGSFDWITPLFGLFSTKTKDYGIYIDSWNQFYADLKLAGIKPKYINVTNDMIVFAVDKKYVTLVESMMGIQ